MSTREDLQHLEAELLDAEEWATLHRQWLGEAEGVAKLMREGFEAPAKFGPWAEHVLSFISEWVIETRLLFERSSRRMTILRERYAKVALDMEEEFVESPSTELRDRALLLRQRRRSVRAAFGSPTVDGELRMFHAELDEFLDYLERLPE